MDTYTEHDTINPQHYSSYKIQPAEYIIGNEMDFWRGSIIKYASRAGKKLYPNQDAHQSEVTDLLKAIRYCEMRINYLHEEGIVST